MWGGECRRVWLWWERIGLQIWRCVCRESCSPGNGCQILVNCYLTFLVSTLNDEIYKKIIWKLITLKLDNIGFPFLCCRIITFRINLCQVCQMEACLSSSRNGGWGEEWGGRDKATIGWMSTRGTGAKVTRVCCGLLKLQLFWCRKGGKVLQIKSNKCFILSLTWANKLASARKWIINICSASVH